MDNEPKCKDEFNAIEIIPKLWLGDMNSAHNEKFIKTNNIKYIINITPDIENKFKNVRYIRIPLRDKDVCERDIGYAKIKKMFDQTSDFIHNAVKKDNILIHCKRGHHRSASLIVAYLMKYKDISYIDAMVYINNIRPCALRRKTCLGSHLLNYYYEQNGIDL